MLSPNDLVKEVAKLLAKDNICYVVRETREILSFEISNLKSVENEPKVAYVEKYLSRYIKIEPMTTQKLLMEMKDFINEINDNSLQKELKLALSRKGPKRNFLQVVSSRIDLNQHWTLYMAERYEAYVEQVIIADYNY